jgi:hypothetical protein
VVFKGVVVEGAAESLRGLDRFEETLAPLLLALPLAPLQQVVSPWCQLTHHLLDGVIVVVEDVLEARVVPLRDVVSIVEDQLEEEFELTGEGLGRSPVRFLPKTQPVKVCTGAAGRGYSSLARA